MELKVSSSTIQTIIHLNGQKITYDGVEGTTTIGSTRLKGYPAVEVLPSWLVFFSVKDNCDRIAIPDVKMVLPIKYFDGNQLITDRHELFTVRTDGNSFVIEGEDGRFTAKKLILVPYFLILI